MKLIEALEIIRTPRTGDKTKYSVSVICGFHALHLLTFIDAELRRRHADRVPTIHAGLYGDFWGNLERERTKDNDAAIVMLEWADLDPRLGLRSLGNWAPAVLPDILQSVRNRGALLNELLPSVAENL